MSTKVESLENAQTLTVCNMLCAFDLRIGNLIDFVGMPSKVLNIKSTAKFDSLYIEHDEGFEWTEPERCKGLELTEDWLLSWKFMEMIDSAGQKCFENDIFRIYFISDNYEIEYKFLPEKGNEGRVNLFRKFHFIHELQNLYYSLSGGKSVCA